MAQITYDNKSFLNENPSIPEVNKVTDNNMNEIKNIVNQNDDNVGNLSNLDTTDKSSIVKSINEVFNKTKITTLWEGSASTGNLSLNDSIENYDFILLVGRGGSYTRGTQLIPVSLITYGTGDTTPWSVIAFQNASTFGALKINFFDSTTAVVSGSYHANWASASLNAIIGIKL